MGETLMPKEGPMDGWGLSACTDGSPLPLLSPASDARFVPLLNTHDGPLLSYTCVRACVSER